MEDRGDLFDVAGGRRGEQRALILLGVLGLAIALVLGAFFLGRVFADRTSTPASPARPTAPAEQQQPPADADSLAEAALGGTQPPAAAHSATPKAPDRQPAGGRLRGKPYQGPLVAAGIAGVRAQCVSEPSIDAGGRRTTYHPRHTLDGRPATAWRCDGAGRGQSLVFRLRGPQRVAAVGLIPGYAKTDPVDGTDRYAENRRISRVRWDFGGGRFVVQRLRTAPRDRSMQMMRIPPVRTRRVTVTILDSTRAARNTVAISEARIAVPAG